jgi:hypothetical protein
MAFHQNIFEQHNAMMQNMLGAMNMNMNNMGMGMPSAGGGGGMGMNVGMGGMGMNMMDPFGIHSSMAAHHQNMVSNQMVTRGLSLPLP